MRSAGVYSLPVAGLLASSTCAYSLYVIASAASMSPVEQADHVEVCCSGVTSLAGSRPALVIAAKISYSLPKPQLPIFLPLKSAADGDVLVLEAHLQRATSAGRPGRCR